MSKQEEMQIEEITEDNLNEYALSKVEGYLEKLADKLYKKCEREVIKETRSLMAGEKYRVTVLCYFTDDIMKIVKPIEEKKKWRILEKKNYIEEPKKDGYRGCQLKIAIPVDSEKNETAVITLQIHTIGMEYWMEMESQIPEGKIKKKENKLKNYAKHIAQVEEEILKLHKK